MTAAALAISTVWNQSEARGSRTTEVSAEVALTAAAWWHQQRHFFEQVSGVLCAEEFGVIKDAVSWVAAAHGQAWYDLGDPALQALLSPDLGDDERITILTRVLDGTVIAANETRELLKVDGPPIVGIQQFWSHANDDAATLATWRATHEAGEAIGQKVEAMGWRPEVTARHAPPGASARRDPATTRAAVLRSSAQIVFTAMASFGTGHNLELVTLMQIPTLILVRLPELLGRWEANAEVGRYETEAEAVTKAANWLAVNRGRIERRSRDVQNWAADPNGNIHEHMLAADDAVFEDSRITRFDAEFWSQPIHYAQAPQQIRQELDRLHAKTSGANRPLTGPGRLLPLETANRNGGSVGWSAQSIKTLFAYSAAHNYDNARFVEMLEFAEREIRQRGPSSRSATLSLGYQDWADVDKRLAWDPPK
ncbi:MAG: hypothetical protein LBE08_09600 [Bifidobacteriaceae bacterium]|nr:hypothetical protein [Bifidobacteriaceae bacterium]